MSLLVSNVVDANYKNSCLFTKKGHFHHSDVYFIGILAYIYKLYLTNGSTQQISPVIAV